MHVGDSSKSTTAVEIDGGCEAGKIYEVVYRGTGAVPVGLGFAAVRDIASFMKYGESRSCWEIKSSSSNARSRFGVRKPAGSFAT